MGSHPDKLEIHRIFFSIMNPQIGSIASFFQNITNNPILDLIEYSLANNQPDEKQIIGPLTRGKPVRLSSVLSDNFVIDTTIRRFCEGRIHFIKMKSVRTIYYKTHTEDVPIYVAYLVVKSTAYEVHLGTIGTPPAWDWYNISVDLRDWLLKNPSCRIYEQDVYGKKFLYITMPPERHLDPNYQKKLQCSLFQKAYPVDYSELVAEVL